MVCDPKTNTQKQSKTKQKDTLLSVCQIITPVAEQIQKRKNTDKALTTLHFLVYGIPPKRTTVKRNLRAFSGVRYGANLDRARLEQRIASRSIVLLRDLCALFGLTGTSSRAEIVQNIADFLERPAAAGAPAKKGAKRASSSSSPEHSKKAKAAKKEKKAKEQPPAKKAKKDKKSKEDKKKQKKNKEVKGPLSAYMLYCKAKRAGVVAANKGMKSTDVMKKLAAMWRGADEKTRAEFEALAQKDKKRYEKELRK